MARILNTPKLVIFLLLFISVANGSIQWRRVTKTTPAAIRTTTTEATPSATRTPITWKRSTLSRKSTTKRDVASLEEETEEEEDIEVADSREDISVFEEDTEQESSVKKLEPGSRPGFWFDSSRRRKPSSLLRPGSRKSSLFPSKPSSSRNSTTEAPAHTSIPSTTAPKSIHSPKINHTLSNKSNAFGRNHSTKPPVAFRRRLKTTKSPRKTTTTAVPDIDELENDEELPLENEDDITTKEKITVSSSTDNIPTENLANKNLTSNKTYESVRLPGLGIRRRFKNGTRAPWRKEGVRFSSTANSLLKISKTTSSPQLKRTTTIPKKVTTPGYTRSTRKPTVPSRIKSRTKANKTTSLPYRKKTSTPAITLDTETSSKKPTEVNKGPTNLLKNRNVHRFNRLKPKPIPIEAEEENVDITTHEPFNDIEFITKATPELHSYTPSTVEPFFLTRDYGELVTAIPEVRRKKGRIPKTTTTTTPATELYDEEVQDNENFKIEEVNNTNIDTISREAEIAIDNNLKSSAAIEAFKLPESISRHSIQLQRSSTSKPSTQIPLVSHTTDPGSNAYVVWSLGQGGSGWSYEKQGGQVKWSAQNSQAEGDRWSVQGSEEKSSSNSVAWSPTNSTSRTHTDNKSERVVQDTEKKKKVSFVNSQNGFHNANYWAPVTYIPKLPYRNETLWKLTTPVDIKTLSPNDIRGFSPLPPGITDFSPVVYPKEDDSLLSGHPEFPIQNINTPAFGTNAHYQNIETETYTLDDNKTSSLNEPFASENGKTVTETTDKEQTNLSNVQEHLIQSLKTSNEWNLPTTIAAPLEGFYGLELENQDMKSNNPSFQINDMPAFGISAAPEGLAEEFRSNVDFTDNVLQEFSQQAKDLSGIPPELAKAVVDAKRWTVVGTGGSEGWSLLGENGKLEWKIHNIDGRWSVISGDKLLKFPVQVSSPNQEASVDDRNDKENLNQENGKSTLDTPTIWKLEDDYNKWKVLSAEGGIQVESPEEQWIPTREYEYDQSDEVEDDYYDDEGDYEVLAGNNFSPSPYSEILDDRPLWGTGENQMVRRYPGAKSTGPPFIGGIESANTKEDAIDTWKSLLVDQGKWKNSEETSREISRKTFNSKHFTNSPSIKNSEWERYLRTTSEPFTNFSGKNTKETYLGYRPSENSKKVQGSEEINFENRYNNIPSIDETDAHLVEPRNEGSNKKMKPPKHSNFHPKDHAKIDMLINKLENVQKEAKGRAVVDLSQLLKLIKTNRNVTSLSLKVKGNPDVKNRMRETDLIDTQRRGYNNDRNQNLENKDDSVLQRYQESDKLSPENQSEEQHGVYKTYTNRYIPNGETSKERYSTIPKTLHENSRHKDNFATINRQNEQITRHQNKPFRGQDSIYNQEHGNTDSIYENNLPLRIRNNPTYRHFKEHNITQMKSRLKHNEERFPNIESYDAENKQHFLSHSLTNNKQDFSNFEESSPDEQRRSDSKNPEKFKYDRDINLSSEEYKIRRNFPSDSTKYRKKPGNDPEKIAYSDAVDTGTDYQLINEDRQVQRNKPKRKHNRFHTAPRNRNIPREHHQNLANQIKPLQQTNENNTPYNRDTSEDYTNTNKYQTSRNRRKKPQVAKSRPRSRGGRPEYSKEHSNSRTSLDSSEKLIPSKRKHHQGLEGYNRYRRPEENVYESSPEVYPMRQNQKLRSSKPNQPSPIVISSETEIEDDEDGAKKNRKIIVIDYAGRQKKKSPIDRKDLELIIRSVKNRRSGVMEEVSNENPHLDTVKGQ